MPAAVGKLSLRQRFSDINGNSLTNVWIASTLSSKCLESHCWRAKKGIHIWEATMMLMSSTDSTVVLSVVHFYGSHLCSQARAFIFQNAASIRTKEKYLLVDKLYLFLQISFLVCWGINMFLHILHKFEGFFLQVSLPLVK